MTKLDDLIKIHTQQERAFESRDGNTVYIPGRRFITIRFDEFQLMKMVEIPSRVDVVDVEGVEKMIVDMAKKDIKRYFVNLVFDDIYERNKKMDLPVFNGFPVIPMGEMKYALVPYEFLTHLYMQSTTANYVSSVKLENSDIKGKKESDCDREMEVIDSIRGE